MWRGKRGPGICPLRIRIRRRGVLCVFKYVAVRVSGHYLEMCGRLPWSRRTPRPYPKRANRTRKYFAVTSEPTSSLARVWVTFVRDGHSLNVALGLSVKFLSFYWACKMNTGCFSILVSIFLSTAAYYVGGFFIIAFICISSWVRTVK